MELKATKEKQKNKQEKKLITRIVCINCHAFAPRKSYFRLSFHPQNRIFSPSKRHQLRPIRRFTVCDSCLRIKKSHHPLTYCNFFIFPTSCKWKLHFYGILETDFLVKFEDDSWVGINNDI
jgi:hypothetical protein